MTLRWISLAILLLAAPVHAADEWKTYRYPEYGFAAEYPGVPVPQNAGADPKRLVRAAQYWADKGDVSYGVFASQFLHDVIASLPADEQIQNVLAGVRGSLRCSVRSQRPITFAGGTAWEFVLDKCPVPMVGAKLRVLIASDWLYQFLVLGHRPGLLESPDTERFLQSFSLVAR